MDSSVQFYSRPAHKDLLASEEMTHRPVYIDFDYTLFGCNSTELFIASCKPSIFAAMIEFCIRRCVPWRLLRRPWVPRLRDYICCLVLLVMMPWSFFRWRRTAPALFERFVSSDVRQAIQRVGSDRLAIISFGMALIIRPLLRSSELRAVRLVATPLLPRPRYFAQRKRDILEEVIGAEAVEHIVFVTDSLDDADLLAAAHHGILIDPQGPLFQASEHLYFPLRYTAQAKYTPSYVMDQLLFVEFPLLMIGASTGALEAMRLLAPMAALFLSMMCVYEIGYFENDMRATRFEKRARITAAVDRFRFYPMQPAAWIWSAIFAGMAGAAALKAGYIVSGTQLLMAVLLWAGCLAALRLAFTVYNGPSLTVRLYLYPVLQALKFVPIFLLVAPTVAGAFAICCQIATMWAIYVTYRLDGRSKDVPKEQVRVMLLAIAAALLMLAQEWRAAGFAFQLGALSIWCAARLCKAPALAALRQRRLSGRGRGLL